MMKQRLLLWFKQHQKKIALLMDNKFIISTSIQYILEICCDEDYLLTSIYVCRNYEWSE